MFLLPEFLSDFFVIDKVTTNMIDYRIKKSCVKLE